MIDAGRAARHLDAETAVLVGIAGRGQLGAHLRPVGVQLFSRQHGQRGGNALAEVEAVDEHRHLAIGGHADESRGLLCRRQRCGRRGRIGGERRQHTQAKASTGGNLEELPALQAGVRLGVELPRHAMDQLGIAHAMALAASWMAARIRA